MFEGCTRQDAIHNLNRMEAEGMSNLNPARKISLMLAILEFIQTKTTQIDELGFITSETITKTTKASKKKKPNKKNGVKPQPVLVKTRAALKGLERYFDPRGELEKELVESYRVSTRVRLYVWWTGFNGFRWGRIRASVRRGRRKARARGRRYLLVTFW